MASAVFDDGWSMMGVEYDGCGVSRVSFEMLDVLKPHTHFLSRKLSNIMTSLAVETYILRLKCCYSLMMVKCSTGNQLD